MSAAVLRLLLALSILAGSIQGQSQVLTLIPDVHLHGVSDDGTFAVGRRVPGTGVNVPVRHAADGGLTELPGALIAHDIDLGGNVLIGEERLPNPEGQLIQYAHRWEGAGPWVPLPSPPPWVDGLALSWFYPADMSSDGSVVVGWARYYEFEGPGQISDVISRPWRWTQAGGTELLPIPPGGEGEAWSVSGDGLRIGGWAYDAGAAAGAPVIWSGEGPQVSWPLGDPSAGEELPFVIGNVRALDHDGGAFVGSITLADKTVHSIIWRKNQPLVQLPNGEPPFDAPQAVDLADDALAVVGTQQIPGLPWPDNLRSWLWTPETGLRPLEEIAAELGVQAGQPEGAAFTLSWVTACSADGGQLVGNARTIDGSYLAFRLALPAPSTWGTWEDLGQGLPGSQGEPVFSGEGLQVPGSETTLRVDNLQLLAQPWCVVGLSELAAPFKGGTLMPHPDLIAPLPPLGFGLSAGLTFAWPEGLPTDTELTWQVWVDTPDGSGPAGFAASNALRSTSG